MLTPMPSSMNLMRNCTMPSPQKPAMNMQAMLPTLVIPIRRGRTGSSALLSTYPTAKDSMSAARTIAPVPMLTSSISSFTSWNMTIRSAISAATRIVPRMS